MAFFDDSQNPFADPSILSATQPAQPATIEFNPFDSQATTVSVNQQTQQQTLGQTGAQAQVGADSSLMREEPPSYSTSSAVKVSTDELERRQRELDEKAAEIQRREEALSRQSGRLGNANNWPPLPACCPIKPCYYQDFDVEISAQYRTLVRLGYYAALAHILIYFLNVIISFAFFMVTITTASCANSQLCTPAGTTFGLSILWFIVFSPGAYVCWFRSLYKAFKNDSSISFFWFFIVSFAQFIVDVIWFLGFSGSGSLGIINGLSMLALNVGMAIVTLIIGGFSAALAVYDLVLLVRVHRIYRTTGASFEKAKQELARGAFSNETVRGAAFAGVQTAVSSQGEAAPASSAPGNSYGVRF